MNQEQHSSDETITVCIGDLVCLYSEETSGYIFCYQTSNFHGKIAVGINQDADNPEVDDPQYILFEICAPNRYKATKKLKKILAEQKPVSEDSDDEEYQAQMAQLELAQKAADKEREANETEQKRQRGKELMYGETIQLRHLYSKKYLHVNTTETSVTEASHLSTELLPKDGRTAQFKINPHYKVKSEGDTVKSGDLVILESEKSPGQFLHVSAVPFSQLFEYRNSRELNISVLSSGFAINRSRHAETTDSAGHIKGCSVVRIFHKEREALLCAEGIQKAPPVENPHLHVRAVNKTHLKHMMGPSNSAIHFWIVQKASCLFDGNAIKWEEHIRFQHLSTLEYLFCASDGTVGLTANRKDPRTVFKLYPVVKKGDTVTNKSYSRIQHAASKFWIADNGKPYIRQNNVNTSDVNDKESVEYMAKLLKWTSAPLVEIKGISVMVYDDAYSIELVDQKIVDRANHISGFIHFLRRLDERLKTTQEFHARRMVQTISALEELEATMVVNGIPNKQNQKFLRNFMIIDIILDILKRTPNSRHTEQFIISVQAECYKVIRQYLASNSRKNDMYIARHLEFFEQQLGIEGPVGLNATFMLDQLLKDNQHLIDQTTERHIDMYMVLIKRKKNYRYLELLNVLCLCNNVPVQDKQHLITERWLERSLMQNGDNVVHHLAIGHEIGEKSEAVYVSTDMKSTWLLLSEFCKGLITADEDYLYLQHQLTLFSSLCKGRNTHAIETISEKLGLISVELAFACLKDDKLPNGLRRQFSEIITDMYVDVPGNFSLHDRERLIFAYNEIEATGLHMAYQRTEDVTKNTVPLAVAEELKSWIVFFLKDHKHMIAEDIERNLLIEKVLTLTHELVDFGYFGDTMDIVKLLAPLLSMIDGRTDIPHAHAGRHIHDRIALEEFQNEGRFLRNSQNNAIVEAKYKAMKIIEMFFNFRFNTRMLRFISEFKYTYFNQQDTELTPFLYPDSDFRNDISLHRLAALKTMEIFRETAFFGDDFVDVLKDLMKYQNDKIVTQCLILLNQYYTAFENLFKKCVQAKLAITEKSNEAFRKVAHTVPQIKILKTMTKMTHENVKQLLDILQEFIQLCCVESDAREPHPFNQEILYNHAVLDDAFDLITLVQHHPDKDEDMIRILKLSLRLLKVMCRQHAIAQGRVFNRIDLLLKIKEAPAELGEMLIEMFAGNMPNCLKILPEHIEAIADLYAEAFHPVWVTVLASLLTVRGYPIKRNQNMVIKGIMKHKVAVSILTDYDRATKIAILQCDESDKQTQEIKHRLCSVAQLFALCATGDNTSVELICQCLLSLDELLDFVNLPELCSGFRSPFVRYIVWAYIRSGNDTAMNVLENNANDPRWVSLLEIMVRTIDEACSTIEEIPRSVAIELFKHRPKNLHRSKADVGHEQKETIHFLSDAGVPFLHAVFRVLYDRFLKLSPQLVDRIIIALLRFAKLSANCMGRPMRRLELLNLLRQISVATNKFYPIPNELSQSPEIVSEARIRYKEYYGDEEVINELFDATATRMRLSYEFKNTVKQQIGFNSSKQYTELDSDGALPLGEEFQTLVGCFYEDKGGGSNRKAYNILPIIRHLTYSWRNENWTETEKVTMAKLDRKLLQILRALVWNEYVKIPEHKHEHPAEYEHFVKECEYTQAELTNQGIVDAVLPHVSRLNQAVVKEVLNLFSIIYTHNQKAPASFVHHVLNTRHEAFFVVCQNQIQFAVGLIKEGRHIHTYYEGTCQETESLYNALSAVAAEGKRDMGLLSMVKNIIAQQTRVTASDMAIMSKIAVEKAARFRRKLNRQDLFTPTDSRDGLEDGRNNMALVLPQEPELTILKDTSSMDVIMRIFQSLCYLQHTEAQNLLREQPSPRTINMVSEMDNVVQIFYTSIDAAFIGRTALTFAALGEMIRGCAPNQAVVFDDKIVDCVNYIMLNTSFTGCSDAQVSSFLIDLAYFLIFLTEENQAPDSGGPGSEVVMGSVSKDGLWQMAKLCYDRAMDKSDKSMKREQRENYEAAGFHYFSLIRRAHDLDPDLSNSTETLADPAWMYYESKTVSVEFVKTNILQKIHFRVTDLTRKAVRSEAQEHLIWEIDRTNPGKKIRDYVAFAIDLHNDIEMQRRINAHPLGRFFTRNWKQFNYACLALSFAIQVALLAQWDSGGGTEKTPQLMPAHSMQFNHILMYTAGVAHNVVCFTMVVSFFLSNAAGYSAWKEVFVEQWSNRFKPRTKATFTARKSKFEVGPVSGATIYYMAFFLCSLLGTVITPAFFAFHLLQIAENNQLLSRVIKAVTLNGQSLLWVSVLGLIIIYIFALVGFLVYRDLFESAYLFCDTLAHCTVTLIREGFIYHLMRVDYPTSRTSKNFTTYALKLIWDLAFFVFILTIGLNVIFGIIVDTFRQLRDAKWKTEQEIASRCFICGRNGYEFEQKGISFTYHLEKEHDMLSYIFLFVEIDDTSDEHLLALEMFVQDMIRKENFNFFPVSRAISLDGIYPKDLALERDAVVMKDLVSVYSRLREEKLLEQHSSTNNRALSLYWDDVAVEEADKPEPEPVQRRDSPNISNEQPENAGAPPIQLRRRPSTARNGVSVIKEDSVIDVDRLLSRASSAAAMPLDEIAATRRAFGQSGTTKTSTRRRPRKQN